MSKVIATHTFPSDHCLEIAQGDLTEEAVDAIVNAANSSLQHGGGVAAAIARQGGPLIQQESDRWVREHGPVSHTQPAYTSGGKLPAAYVIHAVGPVWGTGDEERKLSDAITGSLECAAQLNLQSIALPAISTGIFGFPVRLAAHVILAAIRRYFKLRPDSSLRLVRLTLFDDHTTQAFLNAYHDHFSS